VCFAPTCMRSAAEVPKGKEYWKALLPEEAAAHEAKVCVCVCLCLCMYVCMRMYVCVCMCVLACVHATQHTLCFVCVQVATTICRQPLMKHLLSVCKMSHIVCVNFCLCVPRTTPAHYCVCVCVCACVCMCVLVCACHAAHPLNTFV